MQICFGLCCRAQSLLSARVHYTYMVICYMDHYLSDKFEGDNTQVVLYGVDDSLLESPPKAFADMLQQACDVELQCLRFNQLDIAEILDPIPAPARPYDDLVREDACLYELQLATLAMSLPEELKVLIFGQLDDRAIDLCCWSLVTVTYNRAAKQLNQAGLPIHFRPQDAHLLALRDPGDDGISWVEEMSRSTAQHPTAWEELLHYHSANDDNGRQTINMHFPEGTQLRYDNGAKLNISSLITDLWGRVRAHFASAGLVPSVSV